MLVCDGVALRERCRLSSVGVGVGWLREGGVGYLVLV